MLSNYRIQTSFTVFAILVVFFFLSLPNTLNAGSELKLPSMPAPVSNSAGASTHPGETGQKVFSFMGMGAKKTWDGVTNRAFELDLKTGLWEEKRSLPGVVGRLGASAVAVSGQVFIFGGYVLDREGTETTQSDLNVYVPFEDRYYRGKDVPVPVEDAVVGLFHERFIYVIGGRSKGEAVRNVQIYDTEKDTWSQGTPLKGPAVFGHAGAILGDSIIYVNGAYRNPEAGGTKNASKYVASGECWMGKIPTGKHADISQIEWTKLPGHPGNARFRIAAGAGPEERKGGHIYFSGGTDNPYDYNGIGYDGKASEPSAVTFAFDLKSGGWETIDENTAGAVMDTRAVAVAGHNLILVGGMEKGQAVTAKVTIVSLKGKK